MEKRNIIIERRDGEFTISGNVHPQALLSWLVVNKVDDINDFYNNMVDAETDVTRQEVEFIVDDVNETAELVFTPELTDDSMYVLFKDIMTAASEMRDDA